LGPAPARDGLFQECPGPDPPSLGVREARLGGIGLALGLGSAEEIPREPCPLTGQALEERRPVRVPGRSDGGAAIEGVAGSGERLGGLLHSGFVRGQTLNQGFGLGAGAGRGRGDHTGRHGYDGMNPGRVSEPMHDAEQATEQWGGQGPFAVAGSAAFEL
jgi:hypothetical protein